MTTISPATRVVILVMSGLVTLATTQPAAIQSDFTQTEIIEEQPDCFKYPYTSFLQKKVNLSRIRCAIECAQSTKCRRFLYNKQWKMCSLYEAGINCFVEGTIDHNDECYRMKTQCNSTICLRCPMGYYGDRCEHIIQDCLDGLRRDVAPRKPYLMFIQPSLGRPPLEVRCDLQYGGSTFISLQSPACNPISFTRNLSEYSNGFGNPFGNHWIGLENMYNILQNHQLFSFTVSFGMPSNQPPRQQYYFKFNLSSGPDYNITIGDGQLTTNRLGDSLSNGINSINGRPFSTYDRDLSGYNCPSRFKGGWWFLNSNVCSRANVFGLKSTFSESAWHWQDDLGTRTDFTATWLRFTQSW